MIDGILPIDKPQGWTSHDVVARARRVAGQRQVGHAGTLDPLATGLLLVVLGRATRLSSYLMETPKTYRAEVVLGATTLTDDAEAPLLRRQDVPDYPADEVRRCLARFVGPIDQRPPLYAAVKQDGKRLYRLARKGVAVEPEPRGVEVHEIRVERWEPPRLRLLVRCGPGTYIRSLARDIGDALGVGGYLHALRRIASGTFSAGDAVPADGLTRDSLEDHLQPLDRAVLGLPAAVLDAGTVQRVVHGQPVTLGDAVHGTVRLYGPDGALVALGQGGPSIKPFRVFVGGTGADRP